LDVRSGKLLTDQVIVIRGERIERIAGSRELQIPAGATAVDLTRATVLPGLIDCHTHWIGPNDGTIWRELLGEQIWAG
jgi:imidazolonepropionase-like amidohydrolase